MNLTIKHLAPYLPYGLNTKYNLSSVVSLNENVKDEIRDKKLTACNIDFVQQFCKPILRPIGEIEEYFDKLYGLLQHQDVTDFFDDGFLDSHNNITIDELYNYEPEYMPYGTFQVLVKHHFDVFDLIPEGLAVSIHDVG